MLPSIWEVCLRLFLSLHFAVPVGKGKYLINFTLSQILPKSILHYVLPQIGDTISVQTRVGRVDPLSLVKQMVRFHSLDTCAGQTVLCLLLSCPGNSTPASVGEISWFWRIVKYLNKCGLRAVAWALVLVVNSYGEWYLSLCITVFAHKVQTAELLPSASFSLGGLIMILAFVKQRNKAAPGQQCSSRWSLECTDTNVRDVLDCLRCTQAVELKARWRTITGSGL